jgi:hypothetical protein
MSKTMKVLVECVKSEKTVRSIDRKLLWTLYRLKLIIVDVPDFFHTIDFPQWECEL